MHRYRAFGTQALPSNDSPLFLFFSAIICINIGAGVSTAISAKLWTNNAQLPSTAKSPRKIAVTVLNLWLHVLVSIE